MSLVTMQFFDGAVAKFFEASDGSFWEDTVIDANGRYNMALSNDAPSLSDSSWTQIPEIARGNGYFNGASEHVGNRYVIGHDLIQVGNISTMTGVKVVQSAAGGDIGPFQYLIFYEFSSRELICFWDHGSPVTIPNGGMHTFFFNGSPDVGTIFTLRTLEV